MTTLAQSGVGVSINRGDGASSEVFTAIAEINTINFTGMTQDTIDVTTMDSSGGYDEFITGFKNSGECTFNMNFTTVNFAQMKTDFEAVVSKNYRVIFADTGLTQFNFAALCTGLGMPIPLRDKISVDVTLKITGAITMSS